jgi:pimeloyl-[acyl-carrier protein] methyl ester esterase
MIRLIFLPGLDGTGLLFKPLIQLLPETMQATVISYPEDPFLDYPQLERFARNKLPAEPYLLVAESFGGPLAVKLAAEKRPLLRGVVLSATFVRKPAGAIGRWARRFVGPYLFERRWLRPFGTWLMKAQGFPRERIPLLFAALERVPRDVLAARLKAALDVDALPDLKQIQVPVLCLYAKRDLVLAARCGEIIRQGNPQVRSVGLDTPHFLLQDKPAEALAEITKFAGTLGVL